MLFIRLVLGKTAIFSDFFFKEVIYFFSCSTLFIYYLFIYLAPPGLSCQPVVSRSLTKEFPMFPD